jgi:hypothetical protein
MGGKKEKGGFADMFFRSICALSKRNIPEEIVDSKELLLRRIRADEDLDRLVGLTMWELSKAMALEVPNSLEAKQRMAEVYLSHDWAKLPMSFLQTMVRAHDSGFLLRDGNIFAYLDGLDDMVAKSDFMDMMRHSPPAGQALLGEPEET